MKNILVTGISGFLGWHFTQKSYKGLKIHGVYHDSRNVPNKEAYTKFDLAKFNQFEKYLAKLKPEAIIHLAAISKPKDCLQDPDYSYKMNVVVPNLLALYAREQKIPFIFTSTDLVFDGAKGNYGFEASPNPISLYGQQKYEAEKRVLHTHPTATILRLPLLYGYTPKRANFLTDWIKSLKKGKSIVAFTDEYRSPIYVKDARKGIIKLLTDRKVGIWHLGGPERIDRYTMALQLAKKMKVSTDLVIPKLQKEVDLIVPRPADVSLNSKRTFLEGFEPRRYKEGLERSIKLYRKD
ncbi:MAG: SDR family oxidoreductase [Saprospiraceae bacterium]